MTQSELKVFLDEKTIAYNNPDFIATDPIQVPHEFSKKEDIEIAGFLTAIIAWGNRTMIIRNAKKMMALLDNAPHDFIVHHTKSDLDHIQDFVHRTFNNLDFLYFLRSLQNIYQHHGGLEKVLKPESSATNYYQTIATFKALFFELSHLPRTEKHISDPSKNSAAKRINMFLRWMVRNDEKGVDFGIWQSHSPALLSCPLDIHSGRVARKLKLLKRTQNDWKAVTELDKALRKLDKEDPVKYDFALFGLGVFEQF